MSGAYLQLLEEENLSARAAVIFGLGSVGVLLGSRRGRARGIRRLLGAGVGVSLGARFCYPQETRELMEAVARGNVPSVALPELPSGSIVDVAVVSEYANIFITKSTQLFAVISDGFKSLFEGATKSESTKKELTAELIPIHIEKKSTLLEEPIITEANISKESPALIFVPVKSLTPDKKFEGDPGMSNEEDSDMYTTRG